MAFAGAVGAVVLGGLVAWGNPLPAPGLGRGAPAQDDEDDGGESIFGSKMGGVAGGVVPAAESVDKEVIRRIIRQHIDEVKACYEPELAKQPLLGGRIMVELTIAPTGKVVSSTLLSSTMGNARVEGCTVQAVRGWEFPKPPGGGVAIISYPFVIRPAPIPLAGAPGKAGAVEIDPVEQTVLVHRSIDANGVPANGAVAVTGRGLILIDTAWTEPQTELILSWGARVLKRPWIGAVITHEHADRDGGIGVLLRRGIPVAALDLTVAKLARHGIRGVNTLFAASSERFDDPRGFTAYYPGPGHASDNIVVAFPAQRIVFGGCLIKAEEATDLGFTGDADLRAWPASVQRLAERFPDPNIMIPGHGAAEEGRGRALYQRTLELLATKAVAPAAPAPR